VDLPRAEPETIHLIQVLDRLPQEQPYELMVAIGQNVAGEMIMCDLARLPHMLVAGHTGGGKSVFLASLIASLVWRHSAETLRLVLVDPKLMDFPVFETLPHLYDRQVIYEPADAIGILRWLIEEESARRAQLMRETGNRKIESYYRHFPRESLPRIVVIVDEFADIMNSLGRRERQDFERQINRLAATGRARGIHLVMATQRPTVDVVSGNIKANNPARVSFQLTTQTDSRTILDQAGAESLLGQGDMLFLADNQIERLQGYFASDDELEQIIEQRS
jgi:S-DNA-T family DNA segregation ATPase FtsK/SpoIIIE